MEYILVILIALTIKLICTNIKLKVMLKESKMNMLKLCELMLDDEEIDKEARERVVNIYKKIKESL